MAKEYRDSSVEEEEQPLTGEEEESGDMPWMSSEKNYISTKLQKISSNSRLLWIAQAIVLSVSIAIFAMSLHIRSTTQSSTLKTYCKFALFEFRPSVEDD